MHLSSILLHTDQFPTRNSYPFDRQVLQETRQIPLTAPVTFFVGENGAGKSTLLEAVARKCGIHIWKEIPRLRYESNPHEENLHRYLSVKWVDQPVPGAFFASSMFRCFAESLDEWASTDPGLLKYFGGKSLVTQSHGESLMSYFRARYSITGLYFLDEPETALSPKNQVVLLRILEEMSEAGHAQFIVATHSPILMACRGASILSFDHIPIEPIPYEDTDHYRVYKDFLDSIR